jgi:hypothetical protein
MTGRSITPGFAAGLERGFVPWFPLVHMALSSGPVYACGAPFPVDYGGHTYLPLYGMGSIDAIEETDDTQTGITFSLSGVPEGMIALVLAEPMQGRAVTVRLAQVVDGTLHVDDNVWQGLLDVPTLEDGESPVVRVTAEHQLIAWDEPAGLMFSHADQQDLHPGDMFFEHTAALVEATILWPTKEALRREAGG